jgi:hypothetical protein
MGSDIISHRIAIGLLYHKISIACKKMSFIHFRFSDILFSLYVRFKTSNVAVEKLTNSDLQNLLVFPQGQDSVPHPQRL